MLSKCANPGCRAAFRYLHTGRLFQFERRDPPARVGERIPAQSVEFFWLCDDCAPRFQLVSDANRVRVIPVSRRQASAS